VLATRRHDAGGSSGTPWHDYTYLGQKLDRIDHQFSDPHPGVAEEVFHIFDSRGNARFMGSTRSATNEFGIREPVHRAATRNFWGADMRLVAHQRYSYAVGTTQDVREGVFEEYRYDALGRRVLVRSRRDDDLCKGYASCHGAITRYIWDGDALLVELRADGSNSAPGLELTSGSPPHYGRIAYIPGPELDQPLGVIRSHDGPWEEALDFSIRVKPTSPRRVGIDYDTGDFVVFDRTFRNEFHRHVRRWDDLTNEMQRALRDAGMVDRRGRILP
jgi:hypothetical protein